MKQTNHLPVQSWHLSFCANAAMISPSSSEGETILGKSSTDAHKVASRFTRNTIAANAIHHSMPAVPQTAAWQGAEKKH
jgi:hypothetical protein